MPLLTAHLRRIRVLFWNRIQHRPYDTLNQQATAPPARRTFRLPRLN